MKFQKTLLAATLAVVGFGTNAALSDAWLYENASGDQLIKLNLNQGSGVVGPDIFYKKNADDTLTEVGTTLPDGYTVVIGGQIETTFTEIPGQSTSNEDHFGESTFSGYDNVTTLTPGITDLKLNGQLVDPEGEVLLDLNAEVVESGTVATEQYGAGVYTGEIGTNISGKPAYGLATYEYQLENNQNTYVTGNGVLLTNNENRDSVIDYVEGTHTKNVVVAGTVNPNDRKEIRSYLTNSGEQVIEIVGQGFYKADSNGVLTLTEFTAADLNQIATGVADFSKGGSTTSITEIKRMNQTAVTYGESVTTRSNSEGVIVGSTDPNWTFDEGSTFVKPNTDSVLTTTSKEVVTGIIATNEEEGNVYGVEVKKSTTDAEGVTTSAKTTITADYVDSGDFRINGVSIVDNIKTSVDEAVGGATAAIDAKVAEVDVKIAEVDTRLTQFNTTANRLNQRISDVEETAYRGVAIALAAQQQVPNIGAGQFAVFGGVGHYEGESAAALGLASVLADGRTSFSAALGAAGNGEVGGRVGMAYVFGGK